jgi:HEAT repeat protein/energy-coupling factor transporter ATP-binding protein EcfA2
MAKIFVSSTYLDLRQYRQRVSETLRKMNHQDIAMEYFTAEDIKPLDKCLEEVASCDLYVGIFAWRYGYIPLGEDKSITELEYRKAADTGKKCLIFLVDEEAPWPPKFIDWNDSESVNKLDLLKKELSTNHIWEKFNSPADLASKVAIAVSNQLNLLKFQENPKLDIARYSQAIFSRYRVLDMDTLTPSTKEDYIEIQLQNIFIEQNVRENLPPSELPKEIATKIQEEWYLDKKCFPEILALSEIDKASKVYYSKPSLPVLDVIADKRNKHLVILGDPGSGKSTLSKYILLSILGHEEDSKLYDKFNGCLPLLIELRDFIGLCSDKTCKTFLDYFQYLGETQGYSLTEREIHSFLSDEEESLIIFDGLDEIFNPKEWEKVNRMIIGFTLTYPKAKVIVTSRIVGYNKSMFINSGFKHFTIQDFDKFQINTFLDKWYSITLFDKNEISESKKTRIIKALNESDSIRLLAGNPLLLTILAIIGKHQELPKERWELYNHAAGILVQHWDVNRHLKDDSVKADFIDEKDKKELLRRIAFKMQSSQEGLAGNLIHRENLEKIIEDYLIERFQMDHSNAKIISKSIIEQFRKRNFILCLYGADYFGFIHRTFLEYFCADAIVEKFNDHELNIDSLKEKFYSKYWENKTWHEVLRLICGMKDKIAGNLIEHLINIYSPKYYGNRLPWNIVLAIKCLNEVRVLESLNEPSKELLLRIFELFKISHRNEYIASFIAEEIVPSAKTVGTNWPNRNLLAEWIPKSCLFEYYNHSYEVNYSLSNAWADFVTDIGSNSENIYKAIEQKLLHGAKSKYLAILSMGKYNPKTERTFINIVKSALNDKYPVVRHFAVEALAQYRDTDLKVVDILKDCANNDKDYEVREAAIKVLVQYWNSEEEIRDLIKNRAINDKNDFLRGTAVNSLAQYYNSDVEILEMLKNFAINDESDIVRGAAVEALAQYCNSDIEIRDLIKDRLNNDEGMYTQSIVVESLAQYRDIDAEIVSMIKEFAIKNEDGYARKSAIKVLAQYWNSEEEIRDLIKDIASNDKNEYVREGAIDVLAKYWNNDTNTLNLIKDLATNGKSRDERAFSMRTLIQYWSSDVEILNMIKQFACNNKNYHVRQDAIEALAHYKDTDEEIVGIMKNLAISDKNYQVRETAIKVLAKYKDIDTDIIDLIKDIINNHMSDSLRETAIDTLVRCRDTSTEFLDILKDIAINDKSNFVRSAGINTLARCWNYDVEIQNLIKEIANDDKSEYLRGAAIEALAGYWDNDGEIINTIKEFATKDKDDYVRSVAVEALAEYMNVDEKVLDMIKQFAINDRSEAVRGSAVKVLSYIEDREIANLIKDFAINDKSEYLREVAVVTLSEYVDIDKGLLDLIEDIAINDQNSQVRQSAVKALGQYWNVGIEHLDLIKNFAIDDEDDYVRGAAVEALGQFCRNNLEIRKMIKEFAFYDKSEHVRASAVEALSIYMRYDADNLDVIRYIAIHDRSEYVRMIALKVIVEYEEVDLQIENSL